MPKIREQGWCSGDCTRLPPSWPGFNLGLVAMSGLKLVVGSLLCSERFFSGFSSFPLSSKINISKFQFDQMQDLPENHFQVSGLSFLSKYH